MSNKRLSNNIDWLEKYPPRGAWEIASAHPKTGYNHGGYTSRKIRPCPACGRDAVFEEDAYRRTPPHERAKYFYGYCPTCELRTRESGTLKEAVMQWQERKFSPDSWLHCHRPRLDSWGCSLLSEAACRDAYEDARFYVEQMQKANQKCEKDEEARAELNRIEEFFRTSPLAFALDPEAVISKLRKELYPELTPEERMKIPLKLAKLYKGKEIVRKCTAKKNSQKQP